MTEWILILAIGSSYFSNDAFKGMPPVTIPMQSEQACLAAMKNDYPGFGDKGFCINTKTGEVRK